MSTTSSSSPAESLPPTDVLVVDDLAVRLGNRDVFSRLNFRVSQGGSLAIIGPNGCGKTVLFKALIGALPFRGRITWAAGTRIGYVPQKLDIERDLPITGSVLTFEDLEDRLAVMMGGRAAEKLMLSTISTGATDDIQHATELARRMVTEYGMSEKLGSVRYAGRELQYLGGALPDTSQLSPQTQEAVYAEVQRLVAEQYARAQALLAAHRPALASLTEQLLKSETLDGSVVKAAVSAPQAVLGDPVSAA